MNWQTVAVLAVVAAAVAAIVLSYIHKRKKGGPSCGCSCADCALKGRCHR